jgi:hypothetical protein
MWLALTGTRSSLGHFITYKEELIGQVCLICVDPRESVARNLNL